jgi:hypothetical protein
MDYDEPQQTPWDLAKLEELILELVPKGEASKFDLKRSLDLSTAAAQAELLKDISAMANTYQHDLRNHGFIILGAANGAVSFTTFPQNADHLQATIDELVKNYIEPFVHTRLYIFGSAPNTWGVIVIPPTRSAPHVFVKDIQKRNRGDIYVRRGTITDKAQPGDFARFFSQHLEEHAYQLRVEIRDVRTRLESLTSAGYRPVQAPAGHMPSPDSVSTAAVPIPGDLLALIEHELGAARNPIAEGLARAAQNIKAFLFSSDLEWAIAVPDKEAGARVIQLVDERCGQFWRALARVVHWDSTGTYDEAVANAIELLAHKYEPPAGSFTYAGHAIRYYPLVVALHVVFAVGAAKRRTSLLHRIRQIYLASASEYEERQHLAFALFHVKSADAIFQTEHPSYPNSKWCDAVANHIKNVVESASDVGDPIWDPQRVFFSGELMLALTALDMDPSKEARVIGRTPSANYLYFDVARPILQRFLRENAHWMQQVYAIELKAILGRFDETARSAANSGCFADGFAGGALIAAYPAQPASGT